MPFPTQFPPSEGRAQAYIILFRTNLFTAVSWRAGSGSALAYCGSKPAHWPGIDTHSKGAPVAETFEGEAYCVKCKAKRQVTGGHVEEKNGRRMGKGKCPECGTTVVRILGKAG